MLASIDTGRLVWTGAIVGAVLLASTVGGALARRRAEDQFTAFHLVRVIRYTTIVVAVVALLFVWHLFNGHGTLVIGFVIAGLTFALQEVVGAVAGWFNILTGRIYRVGDRIEIGGVHGDVIDVTLLRTKLLEFGAATGLADEATTTWVHGRQYTGRIVFVSNKTTFTEAVFNYSASLDFIWEELTIPIAYGADWKLAERILLEEAERISAGTDAQDAVRRLEQRYPVPQTEVEPRVFVQMTDNWMQLAARFVIPVRQARTLKSEMTRRVRERFDEAGLGVGSTTMDVTVHRPDES